MNTHRELQQLGLDNFTMSTLPIILEKFLMLL